MEIKICNGIVCYQCVSFKPTLLSALSVPFHTEGETREELCCVDNPVNNSTCYTCYWNTVHL